jgi:hypothetical protein
MGSEDIEQFLKKAKYRHLSEATLVSYRDSQLDEIDVALADAHLRLCEICERRLTFLNEEAEALESYEVTEKDRALIRETIRQMEPQSEPPDNILQRLASYFETLVAAWVLPFSQAAVRGTKGGDVIWKYKSEDGLLTSWVELERNANLSVHFSSSELAWKGVRLRFRLGRFTKEVTLDQREGDSNVSAKIVIPRRERPKKMDDLSIEILPAA